jgi:hypothetical protein
MLIFYSKDLFSPHTPQSVERSIGFCRPPATAYSVQWQPPPIPRGRRHPQPEGLRRHGVKGTFGVA